ncbi:MAG TPA: thiamine-phosphate kinase [Geobacterales bacterium]|nr:thiamine-phosphate kinase [Geobacterales bacterium]
MKLAELGEFSFIDRLARQVPPASGVVTGIGDDCAVTGMTSGTVTLTTTDMLLEGIHFDLSFTDPHRLGRKSLAVNLSDVAAMGGVPRFALLSLALPASMEVEFLDCFMAGFLDQARQFDVALIGGDTCASAGGFVISVTVMGEGVPGKVVRRRGARPGDAIYVTGTLGDSALGLEQLRRGVRQGEGVNRHLDPLPRVREGAFLAASAGISAMIDISDGLLADLGHILDQSVVGGVVELNRLPLSPELQQVVAAGGDDPYALPLAGGEDYELLFTAPLSSATVIHEVMRLFGTKVTAIGEIASQPGLTVKGGDGAIYPLKRRGYDHFSPCIVRVKG